jgi:dihydrofolate reductase
MDGTRSRVTIHMAASLDGFIAREDGRVDWMDTTDHFDGGEPWVPESMAAFLASIDCYVMGARTYETALAFAEKGMGWAYGNTPTIVLTNRTLPRLRESIEFQAGDLASLMAQLRTRFPRIWVVGGGAVAGDCLRGGLADEVVYALLPILIGRGIRFFDRLEADVPLHLAETKAYSTGLVTLRYEVRK